jgi:transcriptional regulator with XRE-family HTH domain
LSNRSAFGRLHKEWRARRGFSQLDLALAARTTQRHLSFIESGRATPSPEMILRIAATMDLPLRQQNALLLAAGYAPAWRERDFSTPDLAVVNSALDYMLAQHEPYPAFVVDRCWNLLRANRGAMNLTEFLTGPASTAAASEPVNLAVALVSPDGLRPFIVNWEEVALYFLRGVQADAHADGSPETADLLSRLLAFPEVPALSEVLPPEEGQSPVLPIQFRRNETSLRLFTTIATLGTPRDVTLQEVRIEFFFPMDEATAQTLRAGQQAARFPVQI